MNALAIFLIVSVPLLTVAALKVCVGPERVVPEVLR